MWLGEKRFRVDVFSGNMFTKKWSAGKWKHGELYDSRKLIVHTKLVLNIQYVRGEKKRKGEEGRRGYQKWKRSTVDRKFWTNKNYIKKAQNRFGTPKSDKKNVYFQESKRRKQAFGSRKRKFSPKPQVWLYDISIDQEFDI
jgi:hypothetical protein